MRLSSDELVDILTSLFDAVGAHPDVRDDVASATVRASLRGIDSHGVAMIPKILKRIDEGRTQVDRPAEIVADGAFGSITVIDAKLAPGQHSEMVAARQACQRAAECGVGLATVRNSTHFGCCSPFLDEIVEHGYVGFVGSNSLRSMAAFGSGTANLGNNPFGFAAPRASGAPFIFDFSSAVMSFGRRNQLRQRGEDVPAGAFVENEEASDSGVCEIADGLDELAVPFGAFKGASVAVMVEVLSGLLSSGHVGARTETVVDGRFLGPSHFALAIDPAAFGAESFERQVEAYVGGVRKRKGDQSHTGDRANVERQRRERDGVPISPALGEELDAWCRKLGTKTTWAAQ